VVVAVPPVRLLGGWLFGLDLHDLDRLGAEGLELDRAAHELYLCGCDQDPLTGPVGYESLAYWGLASTNQVPVGTLVVDVVDAKRNEGIWRGAVRQPLKGDDVDRDLQRVERAVEKLFSRFPPR
jgi:hypothetical protein